MLATTLDQDGRRVELSEERWAHIKKDHPELATRMRDVMEAVREPTMRMAGRRPGEEWFFLESAGPSRWLEVVVHYEQGAGSIMTAFPRALLP